MSPSRPNVLGVIGPWELVGPAFVGPAFVGPDFVGLPLVVRYYSMSGTTSSPTHSPHLKVLALPASLMC